MSTSPRPSSDTEMTGELYQRLSLLVDVIEDCKESIAEIIGEGHSATLPMFQLSFAIDDLKLTGARARSLASRLYVGTASDE